MNMLLRLFESMCYWSATKRNIVVVSSIIVTGLIPSAVLIGLQVAGII